MHDIWLVGDYLPCFEDLIPKGFRIEQTIEALGGAGVEPVRSRTTASTASSTPTGAARTPTSIRTCAPASQPARSWTGSASRTGVARLAADLESGAWERRHADLLDLEELDLGYRLLIHPP